MLPYGNSSGYGPQGYGAQPTPFEALWAQNKQRSSMQLAQWAALTDPTVRTATRLASDLATGGRYQGNSYDDFLRTAPGSAIQAGMAAAGMNTNLFGGSLGQMAFGMQQALGSGGFRLDGGRFGGGGFVTDMTSKYMIDSIRDNFFDPTTGMGNYKTQGLNKQDFGELAFNMSRRGMFAGLDIGGMRQISSQEEYKSYINDLGQSGFGEMAKQAQDHMDSLVASGSDINIAAFEPNKAVFEKMNRMFEGAAETISSFRDVFGQNMSASQAIQEAEKLTGSSFSELGVAQQARDKLNKMKTISQYTGMDMQAMLAMDQTMAMSMAGALSQQFGGSPGTYSRFSAATTPYTWANTATAMQTRAEQVRMGNEEGRYIRSYTQDEVMAVNTQAIAQISSEEGLAAEALYIASSMNIEDSQKAALRKKVEDMGKLGSKSERAKARSELAAMMKGMGFSPGEILASYGGDPIELLNMVDAGAQDTFIGMTLDQENARTLAGTLPDMLKKANTQERLGIGGTEKSLKMIQTMLGAMDPKTTSAVIKALKAGDDAEVTRLINSQDEYLKEFGMKGGAEEMKQLISDVHLESKKAVKGGDGYNMGGALEEITTRFTNDRQNSNFTSTAERVEAERQALQSTLLNKSLGRESLAKGGFWEQMIRGAAGEGSLSDTAMLDYMEQSSTMAGDVSTYKITSEGANLSKEEVDKLAKQLGGDVLDKKLGITRGDDGSISNWDDVSKKLGTASGVSKLVEALENSGTAWDVGSIDGKASEIRVADKQSSDITRSKADELNKARSAISLSGLTAEEKEAELKKLDAMAEDEMSAEIEKRQREGVLAFNRDEDVMDTVVSDIASGDATALEALESSGSMEEARQSMISRMQELEKTSNSAKWYKPWNRGAAEEAGQKLGQYQDAMSRMEANGNEYLGRIELVMGDKMSGTLFKKGN